MTFILLLLAFSFHPDMEFGQDAEKVHYYISGYIKLFIKIDHEYYCKYTVTIFQ